MSKKKQKETTNKDSLQCVSVITGGQCLFENHPLICSDCSFNDYTLFVCCQSADRIMETNKGIYL